MLRVVKIDESGRTEVSCHTLDQALLVVRAETQAAVGCATVHIASGETILSHWVVTPSGWRRSRGAVSKPREPVGTTRRSVYR